MTHARSMNKPLALLAGLALGIGIAIHTPAHAALVNLAQAPLVDSTTTSVLPNILFTLDDSGSMAWDFMPDWVGRSEDGTSYDRWSYANLYRNSAWNVIYYNPAITYSPPVYFNNDGTLNTTTYPSKTSGWNAVKYDAYNAVGVGSGLCPNGSAPVSSACDLTGGKAMYFTFVPGEYCTQPNLKTCITTAAPSVTYPYPAPLRWCNNAALNPSGGANKCQALKNATYKYPRYPGAIAATATLTVSAGSSTSVSSVKVNGLEILSSATSASSTSSTVANRIRDRINACTAGATGSCTTAGYSATTSGSVVTIYAPSTNTYTPVVIKSGGMTITATAFSGGVPGSTVYTVIDPATTSYPYPGSAAKHPNRTDCAGATCTYNEEMTNFANWFTYYHVRMSMMKTGVSRAFKTVDNKFRVGFNTISYTGASDGTRFLHIDKFELAHKKSWYDKLFATAPDSGTPLRDSLGKIGQLFAKKVSGQTNDPMQYSCQQNFSILSTDGYWNTSNNAWSLSGGLVGNKDGGSTPRPMYEGPTATNDTLADIAKYYYDTDIRTTGLGNCTGALGFDVCENNVFTTPTDTATHQHLTSFSIGLGADGRLVYQDDYATATQGDFYDLKNNLNGVNWPNPITDDAGARIDDLWHAAVNGRGEYYSAKNPDQIVKGLNKALSEIAKKVGSGAAAATSTPNISSTDNKAFAASYVKGPWTGNLEARLINTDTGEVSETAQWCVEDLVADSCSAPAFLHHNTGGGSDVWYCVTPPTLPETCPGVGCVEVSTACTGSLKTRVSASNDTRVIYMKNDAGSSLVPFTYANMTASQKAYFSSPTALSQWPSLTADQQNPAKPNYAGGANLVNYLRGQNGFEDRTANVDKLFRYREATLGDAVESQPIFIGKPVFSYTDAGYADFKTAQAWRAKTVFLGTNDGMLHAFDVETGAERWAYVPSMVMSKMWKLADKNYATMHTYFVNGSAVTSDIYDGTSWRSILVGSLRGGGRGFYALDVTDPANPTFLWEFTYTQTTDHALKMDDDLGYSFAEPKIGKRPSDGKWVVFLSSGYNNVTPGNGKGYVYELDPLTGNVLHKIGTGTGDTTTPSGLAKIEFYADASERDNTAKFIYGGDLLGNIWRIKMSDYSIMKFAVLKDGSSVVQPVTTRPELALINDKRVVFVGTGKYLETADLTTTQQQTVYAIKDDDATSTFDNPRTGTGANLMVQQTISNSGSQRTTSNNDVSFVSGRGWYINLPDTGERVNVDPRLEYGILLYASTVPTNTVCAPGGYGYHNFVQYKSGKNGGLDPDTNTPVGGSKTDSPGVGLNIYMLPSGKIVASGVTANNPTPELIKGISFDNKSGGFQGKRVIWREMVP